MILKEKTAVMVSPYNYFQGTLVDDNLESFYYCYLPIYSISFFQECSKISCKY